MARDRRSFLKTAGMATAVASAVPLALSLPGGVPGGPSTVLAADKRTYTGGRFALDIDGAAVGMVTGFSGGHPYGVVSEVDLGGGLQKKHISNVKFEAMTIRVDATLGEPLWSWISSMLAGKPEYRSGSVLRLDSSLAATNLVEFEDALITEITFPAMDAGSKETAYLDVVITPSVTYLKPGKPKPSPGTVKQKMWTCSNFRLRLGDLPCSRVSKVDSFTIKQGITESEVGDRRIRTIEPTKIEYPNLSVTLSETDGAPWFAYLDSFVVQGKNGPADEITGALEYLSPDMKSALAKVSFAGVGLFKVDHSKESDASAGKGRTVEAELYTTGVQFSGPPRI